ncbi:cupin domain-containing protein [Cohaesibacter celericrescens]|uniref:Aldehyde dehydrogenase n=1 Tax=Cohaesibacter celericrescens TaxID=2067669 RepID=A0A2N5XQY3_9HYPH|nr:cupin domain-containing protein [Cohaesibacter celericrescens]PLW76921.1 aldehyde dehydrogenase [Cohaesibacter celericrescens]
MANPIGTSGSDPQTDQSAGEGADVGADVGARLRHLRNAHGLSQRELARRAGVANATISQIESGGSNPSVGALKRILDGLSMDLAGFFSFELATGERHFYKASELLEIGKDKLSYRLVAADRPGRSIQMLHETLMPGADTGKILLSHAGEECGIVLSGSLEVSVGEMRQVLRQGDAWYFDSTIPHRFRNKGAEPCICISAGTPPTF